MSEETEKPNDPTPHKLKKAREQGNIAKSKDVVTVTVLTGGFVFLAWLSQPTYHALMQAWRLLWMAPEHYKNSDVNVVILLTQHLVHVLIQTLPFFGVVVLMVLIGNIAQSGLLWAPQAMTIDWNRLNLSNGLKKIFSKDALFNACKIIIKVSLIGWLAWWSIRQIIMGLHQPSHIGGGLTPWVADLLNSLSFRLILLLWIMAAIDYVFNQRQYIDKLKMSKKELTDEMKQMEGDPRIKSKLMELRREARKRSQSLSNTKKADVIITNPTHYAVALKYDKSAMRAPQLVSKGSGILARAIRRIGSASSVPIIQNPSLARKIYFQTKIDTEVPSSLFPDLVRIYVWLYAMQRRSPLTRAS